MTRAERAWSLPSTPGGLAMHRRAILAAALLALSLGAAPAAAACFADYKAKRDAPLQLHYGVIELPDDACAPGPASAEIARRIAADGWTLLAVVSIFDADGLDRRRSDAGPYFLRY
jgi:uncharacterized membrane protein